MKRTLTLTLSLTLAALWGNAAFGQTKPAATRPAVVMPAGNVVAWWQPPVENLATVKARGCNAVVGPELGNPRRLTAKAYCEAADALGLGVIGNKFLLENGGYRPKNLIAWIVDDEPTSANHLVPPEAVAAQAAAFRAIDPTVPVLCSHAGDKLTSAGAKDNALYEAYVAAVDVSTEDWYPVNREFARYPITLKGKAIDYLKARGAKVVGSVIETSWQELNAASPKGRCPTPDEVEAEVNEAAAHGATWFLYFSTAEKGSKGWPGNYDPTPPDNVARITAINAKLNPPVVVVDPVLVLKQDVATLRAQLDAANGVIAATRADLAAARAENAATFDRIRAALVPTTQPSGGK